MIISYDMFRRHFDMINSVLSVEIIICDEGHRLKNVDSTKTTTALRFSNPSFVFDVSSL